MRIIYSIIICLFLFSCSNQEQVIKPTLDFLNGEWKVDSTTRTDEFILNRLFYFEKGKCWEVDFPFSSFIINEELVVVHDSIFTKNIFKYSVQVIDSNNIILKSNDADIYCLRGNTIIDIEKWQKQKTFKEGTFIVDDYPITNQMLEENRRKMVKDNLSSNLELFVSDDKKEFLAFELYTDYHRMLTYHFKTDEITDILDRIELGRNNADENDKQKYFKELISKSKPTDFEKFISNKGIQVGLDKKKIIEIYGTPHKQEITDKIEILKWEFIGDILYDGKTELNGKPLAKDNYGHQVTIFLKNGKVIGQILHNEIP